MPKPLIDVFVANLREIERLQSEVRRLEQENVGIQERLRRLETGPSLAGPEDGETAAPAGATGAGTEGRQRGDAKRETYEFVKRFGSEGANATALARETPTLSEKNAASRLHRCSKAGMIVRHPDKWGFYIAAELATTPPGLQEPPEL